jgi:endoglucanase
MRITATSSIAAVLLALVAIPSCVKKLDPTSPEVAAMPQGKACPGEGMIDDGEDNNNQIMVAAARNGYWYTFVDGFGSDVTPIPGDVGGIFEMTAGGANKTGHAARMQGTVSDGVGAFAGMGFNLVEPKLPYDASRYQGITFFAKKGPGSTRNLRVKLPDINTDPDGDVCSGCYNDFARDIVLTPEWKRYTIFFDRFKQLEDWGDPIMAEIDVTKLFAVQFHVREPGAKFDVWVDEVQFTGCP